MSVLAVVLIVALLAAVVFVVSAPLRAAHRPADTQSAERDQLEAAREAKYREIRDCELDYRTGKLSPADYQATDGQLRAEALAILDRIEALEDLDIARAQDGDELEV